MPSDHAVHRSGPAKTIHLPLRTETAARLRRRGDRAGRRFPLRPPSGGRLAGRGVRLRHRNVWLGYPRGRGGRCGRRGGRCGRRGGRCASRGGQSGRYFGKTGVPMGRWCRVRPVQSPPGISRPRGHRRRPGRFARPASGRGAGRLRSRSPRGGPRPSRRPTGHFQFDPGLDRNGAAGGAGHQLGDRHGGKPGQRSR